MRWTLVLACMALVVWIRTQPLSLPVAEEQGEKIIRDNLRDRLIPIIQKLAPDEDWRPYVEDATEEWVRRNRAQFDADKASIVERIKSELTFEGKDGRRYVLLGDFDSYVWLRNARNYLRHGTTCDAVVNGECRDTFGNAPVGYRMVYNRSLHIAAIVAVHRAITFFRPDYPLSASAFFVPVLVGTLGVLPAFFLGCRLGGPVAGVFAALLISLQPEFLRRSLGSDNDVWNVVMPLFIAWTMIAALHAKKHFAAPAYAAAAGLLTALHAATWRGWLFTYVVILAALVAHLILSGIGQAVRHGARRVWKAEGARNIARIILAYYVSTGVLTWLAGAEEASFSFPFRLIASVAGVAAPTTPVRGGGNLWPETLRTVAELGRPLWDDLARSIGGRLLFLAGWLGLLSLVLPQGPWRPRHFGFFVWTAALYAACYYPLFASRLSAYTIIFLFALPLLVELLIRSLEGNSTEDDHLGCALIVIVWFLAALVMSHRAIRFVILFAVPFGLAASVAAARLRRWLGQPRQWMLPPRAMAVAIASHALVLAGLYYPLLNSYRTAEGFYPSMNSAWWNSLIKVRDESPPDAIVNTWWDYGYWVKYVAERRVSSDGGSLRTHVPHWLAKALLAPSDAETLGILRMLNCGSDATPLPEGAQGAYGKLRAMGLDDVAAYSILGDLLGIGRAEARRYLAGQGFTAEQQNNILASTHCRPPESFLILSRETLGPWLRLGSWDMRRAYLVFRTRLLPEEQAVEQMVKRFGYTREQAERMYLRLSAMKSDAERKVFVAPLLRVIPGEWERCRGAGIGSEMRCRIAFTDAGGATTFMDFLYDSAAPKEGRLKDGAREGAPGVVVVAREWGLEDNAAPSPEFPDIGVLLDPAGERVLVGTPFLIRSTLVRLIYLDERYTKRFKRFDKKTTLLGHEVMTWKIDWKDE